MKKKYILATFLVLTPLVFLTGLKVYASLTDTQITACVKKDGSLYIIAQGASCKGQDNLLTWNITGPQGDKGDTGDMGEQGPQGIQGERGIKGASLHLYDANNQDLGVLTYGLVSASGVSSPSLFSTYLFDPGVFVSFRQVNNSVIFNPTNPLLLRVYFPELNCTGQPFSIGINPLELFAAEGGGYVIWTDRISNSDSMLAKSHFDSNGCVNTQENPDPQNQVHVKYVNNPFTLPIAWPLQIVEQ